MAKVSIEVNGGDLLQQGWVLPGVRFSLHKPWLCTEWLKVCKRYMTKNSCTMLEYRPKAGHMGESPHMEVAARQSNLGMRFFSLGEIRAPRIH